MLFDRETETVFGNTIVIGDIEKIKTVIGTNISSTLWKNTTYNYYFLERKMHFSGEIVLDVFKRFKKDDFAGLMLKFSKYKDLLSLGGYCKDDVLKLLFWNVFNERYEIYTHRKNETKVHYAYFITK